MRFNLLQQGDNLQATFLIQLADQLVTQEVACLAPAFDLKPRTEKGRDVFSGIHWMQEGDGQLSLVLPAPVRPAAAVFGKLTSHPL